MASLWQDYFPFISNFHQYIYPKERKLLPRFVACLPPLPHNVALSIFTISPFSLQTVIAELPPTPSKFHYIFNLKDLSRIFAGMLLIHSNYFKTLRNLVRVWRNEFTRIICDRLISEAVSVSRIHTETAYVYKVDEIGTRWFANTLEKKRKTKCNSTIH